MKTILVCGSAGKTTTAALLERALQGHRAGAIMVGDALHSRDRDLPLHPAEIARGLSAAKDNNYSFLILEAHEKHVAAGIFDKLQVDVVVAPCVRTEASAAALVRACRRAPAPALIANLDDQLVGRTAQGHKGHLRGIGRGAKRSYSYEPSWTPGSLESAMSILLRFKGKTVWVNTRLVGEHQGSSIACAMATAIELGMDPEAAAKAISGVAPLSWRSEWIITDGLVKALIVETAWDAHDLRAVLKAASKMAAPDGRLVAALLVDGRVEDPDLRGMAHVLSMEAAGAAIWVASSDARSPMERRAVAEAAMTGPAQKYLKPSLTETIRHGLEACGRGDVFVLISTEGDLLQLTWLSGILKTAGQRRSANASV